MKQFCALGKVVLRGQPVLEFGILIFRRRQRGGFAKFYVAMLGARS